MTRTILFTTLASMVFASTTANAAGYMKIKGIKGEVVSTSSDTQTARQQNRRVEFKPVKN